MKVLATPNSLERLVMPAETSPASVEGPAPLIGVRKTVVLVFLMIGLGPVTLNLYSSVLPDVARWFDAGETAAKLTVTAFFAGFCATQLVCGPLSDALGRRPVILGFICLYLVATLLCTIAPRIEVLALLRVLQGAGSAFGWSVARAVVRDMYNGEPAARVMALVGVILGVLPTTTPLLGATVARFLGWHGVFFVMSGFACLGLAVIATQLPETNRAVDRSAVRPGHLARNYLFVLRDVRFIGPSVCLGLSIGTAYCLITILPFVLMSRIGLTPTQFGLALMIQAIAYIFGSSIAHRALNWVTSAILVQAGLCIQVAGALILIGLNATLGPSVATVMGPLAVVSMGNATVMPNAAMLAVAPFSRSVGAAAALMSFFQVFLGLVGSIAATAIPDPLVALSTLPLILPVTGILISLVLRHRIAAAQAVAPVPPRPIPGEEVPPTGQP